MNQVELHPFLARPDIVKWCEERGVVLEAYSPLTRGQRFEDSRVQALCKKHSKTPAQVLLRWVSQCCIILRLSRDACKTNALPQGLQQNFVILPKSVTKSRIEENKEIYDFELDAEDMKSLDTGEYTPSAWDPTTAPLSQ